jgi:hypothetical protein
MSPILPRVLSPARRCNSHSTVGWSLRASSCQLSARTVASCNCAHAASPVFEVRTSVGQDETTGLSATTTACKSRRRPDDDSTEESVPVRFLAATDRETTRMNDICRKHAAGLRSKHGPGRHGQILVVSSVVQPGRMATLSISRRWISHAAIVNQHRASSDEK